MLTSHNILILATLLAAIGMWLLLPRGTARGKSIGVVLAVIAFGLGSSQMSLLGNWDAQSMFTILAGVTVVAAAAAMSFRNPVYCAVCFGLSLLGVAGLLLLIGAQFLAVVTIVIYAGAILVTFLFVLMLAQTEGKASYDRNSWEALYAALTGSVIIGVLTMVIGNAFTTPVTTDATAISIPSEHNLVQGVLTRYHVAGIGMELFGRHLIAIEVAGVLLLAAIVGAAVIVAQSKSKSTSESLNSKT